MTPTHTDSPLRRSEIGVFRAPVQPPIINDDEEERRQARRRTVINESVASSTIEDNETLKNCLKIYSENKLSKDNAWSVSLIDTLSSLLDKHHKSLNNFKVAGSSLEASSKVYGLRVDSIHTDVVRMSAGLGKQKVLDENIDTTFITNETQNDVTHEKEDNLLQKIIPKKTKRVRKQVSTITKNKETINGRLDTNPFTDPIFAKLNSIVGSINSSSRLLHNILPSYRSELRLRMDYSFWNFNNSSDGLKLAEESMYLECEIANFIKFGEMNINDCILRPNHTGYMITDNPPKQDEEKNLSKSLNETFDKEKNCHIALAFDINADVEPIPNETPTLFDVEMDNFDDLTPEEQFAINKCKGLRRAPVIIEDMRPIDSTSCNLEYSYRPIEKISQYWAGPSHWKFKKNRNKIISQRLSNTDNLRFKDSNRLHKRKVNKIRDQQVQFGEPHDDLFQKLNEKNKLKKVNIQKKWDTKKFKLPTDLQINHCIFDIYRYAPGLAVLEEVENSSSPDLPIESSYNYNNPVDQKYCSNIRNDDYLDADLNVSIPDQNNDEFMNQTVVEIATDFEGAPDKIIKIVVPFAKRAKVVDMKQLKKCCMQIINSQFIDSVKENISNAISYEGEKYKDGKAYFRKIYKILPTILSTNMVEALSTSVAFYSILHLANDSNLKLIQQEDLNDFQIRQFDN